MINSKDSGLTKLDSEPPTKVFKLLHGSTIALASDNKLLQSGPLSLQQVNCFFFHKFIFMESFLINIIFRSLEMAI